MVEFKIVISTKDGKSYPKEAKEAAARQLFGKAIGDTFRGEIIDMPGYEFEITGGSDFSGFPMRKDVPGIGKRKVLAVKGVGIKPKSKGQRQRKSVRGNTFSEKSAQVNVIIVKEGKTPLASGEKPAAEA